MINDHILKIRGQFFQEGSLCYDISISRLSTEFHNFFSENYENLFLPKMSQNDNEI